MATKTQNQFTLLAEQHLALRDYSHYSEAADGPAPKIDLATLSLLESHADVTITDIAAGMQGLSQLINNYPSDAGMESSIMPRIGSLLRILGEALEFTHDAANLIADQQCGHERIAAKAVSSKKERK